MTGKLITIEGIDGSGKGTQSQLLIKKLEEAGKKVKMYSFPAYEETFFGKEVGAFLRGEFGSIDEVHPKLASVLYASDRLEQKPKMLKDLEEDYYVVCDRYVESNMGHQAAKFPDEERESFIDWLDELEYKVNSLPKPDITFFLDVPLSVSKELVLKKKQRSYTDEKEDIHEAAHGYLDKVYQVYQYLNDRNGWCRVPCVADGQIRSIEDINAELLLKVTVD
jgi:dTMP kinase